MTASEMIKTYKGIEKKKIREHIAEKNKPYKVIIDLPGKPCRSLEWLKNNGNIRNNTKIICIEREKDYIPVIKKNLTKLKLHADLIVSSLENCKIQDSVDFANIDTCSSLSLKIINWLSNLQWAQGADLNLWVTSFRANGQFRADLQKTFLETHEGLRIRKQIKSENLDVLDTCSVNEIVSIAAIYSALNQYDMQIEAPLSYKDNVMQMTVFRFRNITKSKKKRVGLLELLCYEDNYNPGEYKAKNIVEGNLIQKSFLALQKGNTQLFNAIKRKMRIHIQNSTKDPKWIKAGWKSLATRINKSQAKQIHSFIDGV